ncbi:cysteine methyltransferase [Verrucomicrobia bacterium SCGC AG-212-E04]|nr:cysteine methyltransferase [Verrucomicrobia bacterium SCGC AG-212-E04]
MKTSPTITYSEMESPIGRLLLYGTARGLSGIFMTRQRHFEGKQKEWKRDDARWSGVAKQLREYFEGKRRDFDIPLDVEGTDFQMKVWDALTKIPFGRTASYADVARKIGKPKAMRAVGMANGRNPVSIVVPCHRVIGADGSLTGYGGGLDRKKILLDLESRVGAQ